MPRGVQLRIDPLGKGKKLLLLSPEDQNLVQQFIESIGTLGARRIGKYEAYIGKIGFELGKPFEEVTRADLIRYLNGVNESKYADDTKRDIRMIAKKYFRWLHDDEFVKGVRVGNVEGVVGPDDILSEQELDNLRVAARGNIRNAALVETLYELGARPHEILGLKKTDVSFDDYGAKVSIRRGKTGPRTIRVINAAPLLSTWIEHHPLRERDSFLWVDMTNAKVHHPLKWSGLLRVLERLGEQAGIEKRFHAYIFRHTRATNLARTLTEAQLCAVFGWKLGSQMPRRYIHFSLRDVDDAILTAHGLRKHEVQEIQASKKCVRCGTTNTASGETCSRCGMALTLAAAMRKDEELASVQAELTRMHSELEDIRKSLGKK